MAQVELLPIASKRRSIPVDLGGQQAADRDIAGFAGYRRTLPKLILFCTVGIATGGLLFLLAHWFLDIKLRFSLQACHLHQAHFVVVTLADKRRELVKVKRIPSFSGIHVQAGTHMLSDDELLELNSVAKGDGYDKLLEYRCGRYLYSEADDTFLPIPGLPSGFAGQLHRLASSRRIRGRVADEWDQADLQLLYGSNELVIPVKTFLQLLAEEMVHPFYVFQYASVTIWCLQQYFSYSLIILAITLFSILSAVVSTYTYRKKLAALAHYTCEVKVLNGGKVETVQSTSLRPGDVIVVNPGVLPCDVVLVRGECIVDENMLTGEAVPVRKVSYNPAVDGAQYHPDVHKSCTLYGGTAVAQVRAGGKERQTLGVVCRTAFWTAKGQLLKSILFPRQHKMTFASDAMKFIAVMLLLGLLFYIWDIIALASYGASAGFIILKYLDLITIAVPPALPACLTVATTVAISRLSKHEIFVSNPTAIPAAGHLNIICFDKTGTLTEPGLGLLGVLPVGGDSPAFGDMVDVEHIPGQFTEMLATCHGLATLGDELVGDPLDQRLFEATGWSMLDDGAGQAVEVLTVSDDVTDAGTLVATPTTPESPPTPCVLATAHVCTRVQPKDMRLGEYTIIRRFEFSAEKQRNVVVVRKPDNSLHVFAKGSPEMIRRLAEPSSIPEDFDAALANYTREGLRVIGMASRRLPAESEPDVQVMSQEELEQGLAFQGFSILVNALRPDTAEVIGKLHDAGIRTVMVTGDHVRTGVSVAGQCGMLCQNRPVCLVDTASSEGAVADSQLQLSVMQPEGAVAAGETVPLLSAVGAGGLQAAVTGRGFEKLEADSEGGGLDTVLHKAGVFARMSPDDKRLLVELLGEGALALDGSEMAGLGNHVGFCGDGANDVGALKAAHVGVSLCEAEASVAAPLTSKKQSIGCMLTVVAEGRCSLSTSYLIFKYIIVYAFIQVFAVNLMYSFGGSVGNFQYLIQDLLYTTVIASFMGFTHPASKLSQERPPDRLMSLGIWLPVICQFVTCAVFQVVAILMLMRQQFYSRFDPRPEDGTSCFSAGHSNSDRCSQSWENSVAFLMALGQFLIIAFVFNKGPPHRKPLYTNTGLLLALLAQTGFLVFLVLAPGGGAVTHGFAGLIPFPAGFRFRLFLLLLLNLGVSWFADWLSLLMWKRLKGKSIMGVTML